MFEANRNRTATQALLAVAALIFHTSVRRVRQQHRNAVVSLLLQVLQTSLLVLVFFLVFHFLGVRGSPIRGDYLLYILSGVYVYVVHIQSVGAVASAEGPTSPMMQHAPMSTFVSIAASALSTLYMQCLSLAVILLVYHIAFVPVAIDQPGYAALLLLLAWMSGCVVGLLFLALTPWAPNATSFLRNIYIRVNLIASGKMFVANMLPAALLSVFGWNPLFHIIDQMRSAVFLNYNANFTNPYYPLAVTLALLVVGLLAEFFARKKTSISWFAAR